MTSYRIAFGAERGDGVERADDVGALKTESCGNAF
jgi:hypothetical protein